MSSTLDVHVSVLGRLIITPITGLVAAIFTSHFYKQYFPLTVACIVETECAASI